MRLTWNAVDPLPGGSDGAGVPTRNTAAQAFRLSETVAGVQFHPELWPEALRDLIASRRDKAWPRKEWTRPAPSRIKSTK